MVRQVSGKYCCRPPKALELIEAERPDIFTTNYPDVILKLQAEYQE